MDCSFRGIQRNSTGWDFVAMVTSRVNASLHMCVCVCRAPKRCDFTRCSGLFVMHSVLRTHHFASHLVEVCSTARHWFCVTRSVCKESAELFSVDTELSVRDQAHRLYITTFLRNASRTIYESTHAKRVKLMSRERCLFIS